jgi:adenylate cyclase
MSERPPRELPDGVPNVDAAGEIGSTRISEPEPARAGAAHDEAEHAEEWRAILTGTDRSMVRLRRFWSLIPSAPRCKFCNSPFRGPGRILTSLVMHGQSNANPLLCNACFGDLRKHTGGAEVEISVLFADVRGSTGLAEQTSAAQFRSLIQDFYQATSGAIDRNGGMIDKYLGDGIMALFIPALTGENHHNRAVQAGLDILAASGQRHLLDAGIRVGVGVNSGVAFVGAIGSGDRLDFSALGDTVNVAARLGSVAGPDELVVGAAAWDRAQPGVGAAERRSIPIAGRAAPLEVVVVHRDGGGAGTSGAA